MSLTAQNLRDECISYLGDSKAADVVADYGANAPLMLARIARDITGALQEIQRARSDLFRQRLGFIAPAPDTQTVTATQGSTALTVSTPYANNNGALDGATVNIGGQWNEVRRDGGNFVLITPYLGASGPTAMVVFGDSIVLPDTVARVLGQVDRDQNVPLSPLPNRQAFLNYGSTLYCDYGQVIQYPGTAPRRPAIPEAWWVEPYQQGATFTLRLRLTPLPNRAVPISFDVENKAVPVTVADLGTDGNDPGRTFPIPAGMDEEILLPLVLDRWCRSPWFKNQEAKADLKESAATARTLLRAFQKQAQGGACMTVRGYR